MCGVESPIENEYCLWSCFYIQVILVRIVRYLLDKDQLNLGWELKIK